MANREDEWIQILRKNIRLFNGKGWSIRGIKSGKLKKLQITHRIDDGLQHENPRESILTSIEFVQQNSPDIQTLIKDLHDLINERKVSLIEAYKITTDNSESKIKTKSLGGQIAHAEAYKETKSDRRESTLKDLNFRLELACNLLNAQPKPRNSKDFYLKLKKQYFDKAKKPNGEIKNPKGGNGRLRICNDIAAFLKYSVLEKGENTRWLAPDATWRRENIIQTNDKDNEPKVPLKSQELVNFMNILEKEGKHSFRLVVGLMGCFGLRPAQIGAMYPERGVLKKGCDYLRQQLIYVLKKPLLTFLSLLQIYNKGQLAPFFMKWFLKLIPIILLLGFISISPKTRNLIGTSFDYLSKFVLSTVNNKNEDKWLMDKPEWFNKPQEFEPASY